jgi:hypothetical protein
MNNLSTILLDNEIKKKIITYNLNYENIILTDYIIRPGEKGIEFSNHDMIIKQRNIISYMIKKIGINLLTGKSVMNVSLPINIFDHRSLLET